MKNIFIGLLVVGFFFLGGYWIYRLMKQDEYKHKEAMAVIALDKIQSTQIQLVKPSVWGGFTSFLIKVFLQMFPKLTERFF
jgi:cbb3-type cytochrome oxidase subunit 3